MTRLVSSDVVVAALQLILDGLEGHNVHATVRLTNARLGVKRLINQVENQGVEVEPAGGVTGPGALRGQKGYLCCLHCKEDPGYHENGSKDDHDTSCSNCERGV